jgi:predicted acyltransferase
MSQPPAPTPAPRLASLDAYRGFVMLAMVSGGFSLANIAEKKGNQGLWPLVQYQLSHVEWTGCSAWDLIQPSFMFIVGVSMPFSFARRQAEGQSALRRGAHVVWRAALLVLLGIFLRSNGRDHTNFTFEDVTTQIGLGYCFAYLTLRLSARAQAAVAALILVGYWLLFALRPVGTPELAASWKVPDDWSQFTGWSAHWNKHLNPAGAFDRWFLNLFPRTSEFLYNGGGYQTLSFIPSLATTIFGVITGGFLRTQRPLDQKVARLAVAGAAMLAAGLLLDGRMWPTLDWDWAICPVVKRIWTPSWAIFSTGWTLLLLAAFVWIIDLRGYRRWAWPLIVVGMNSIAIYCLSWLMRSWLVSTAETHLGRDIFSGFWGPVVKSVYVTFCLWLICAWLYWRRIFIRL